MVRLSKKNPFLHVRQYDLFWPHKAQFPWQELLEQNEPFCVVLSGHFSMQLPSTNKKPDLHEIQSWLDDPSQERQELKQDSHVIMEDRKVPMGHCLRHFLLTGS